MNKKIVSILIAAAMTTSMASIAAADETVQPVNETVCLESIEPEILEAETEFEESDENAQASEAFEDVLDDESDDDLGDDLSDDLSDDLCDDLSDDLSDDLEENFSDELDDELSEDFNDDFDDELDDEIGDASSVELGEIVIDTSSLYEVIEEDNELEDGITVELGEISFDEASLFEVIEDDDVYDTGWYEDSTGFIDWDPNDVYITKISDDRSYAIIIRRKSDDSIVDAYSCTWRERPTVTDHEVSIEYVDLSSDDFDEIYAEDISNDCFNMNDLVGLSMDEALEVITSLNSSDISLSDLPESCFDIDVVENQDSSTLSWDHVDEVNRYVVLGSDVDSKFGLIGEVDSDGIEIENASEFIIVLGTDSDNKTISAGIVSMMPTMTQEV